MIIQGGGKFNQTEERCDLAAFVLQWYLNASWICWWFGHSFGGRAYINCSFIFAIGLAMLFRVAKKRAVLVYGTKAILIGWNLLFIIQYAFGMLPYKEVVDWRQVFLNQSVVLSKIIDLLK